MKTEFTVETIDTVLRFADAVEGVIDLLPDKNLRLAVLGSVLAREGRGWVHVGEAMTNVMEELVRQMRKGRKPPDRDDG